jgi:hypothetical protein
MHFVSILFVAHGIYRSTRKAIYSRHQATFNVFCHNPKDSSRTFRKETHRMHGFVRIIRQK